MLLGVHVEGVSSCMLCEWKLKEQDDIKKLALHLQDFHMRKCMTREDKQRKNSRVKRIEVHGIRWQNEM